MSPSFSLTDNQGSIGGLSNAKGAGSGSPKWTILELSLQNLWLRPLALLKYAPSGRGNKRVFRLAQFVYGPVHRLGHLVRRVARQILL